MDEILIEEKKYVSSKRAAKITGYAKDYIGQLCREGRVPARLVGRSWYVLESAIQDHRFGDQTHGEKENDAAIKSVFPGTWETPRYEASTIESIPPINRLRSSSIEEKEEDVSEPLKEKEQEKTDLKEEVTKEDDGIYVPIHTTHEPLPEEFLPKIFEHKAVANSIGEASKQFSQRGGTSHVLYMATVALFCSVALPFLFVAVIGTGYLDGYIYKFESAQMISGINVYNK